MDSQASPRRRLLIAAGLGSTLLAGARPTSAAEGGEQVTANEDLMREHGVIRRALLIYAETSRRARNEPASIPLPELARTAHLFRGFAEDYHERALEEKHIFPVVREVSGPVAKLPDVLQEQHRRGREITDRILRIASAPKLGAEAGRLATILDALIRMYEPHAAREDTELFPAWKNKLGAHAYAEMGERFEDIEHQTFGRDGFDDALDRIRNIEAAFGMADLARFTPAENLIEAQRTAPRAGADNG